MPDVGTYKPYPADYMSFGKSLLQKEEEKNKSQPPSKVNQFFLINF